MFIHENFSTISCEFLKCFIYLRHVIENNTTNLRVKQRIIKKTFNYLIKMVFRDYIKNLPNQQYDTIKKLAEITCSSKVSVYRWMSGEVEPPMIKKKIIAEYIGKSVEELFPKINNGL